MRSLLPNVTARPKHFVCDFVPPISADAKMDIMRDFPGVDHALDFNPNEDLLHNEMNFEIMHQRFDVNPRFERVSVTASYAIGVIGDGKN